MLEAITLVHALAYTAVFCAYALLTLHHTPRLWLRHFPSNERRLQPSRSRGERFAAALHALVFVGGILLSLLPSPLGGCSARGLTQTRSSGTWPRSSSLRPLSTGLCWTGCLSGFCSLRGSSLQGPTPRRGGTPVTSSRTRSASSHRHRTRVWMGLCRVPMDSRVDPHRPDRSQARHESRTKEHDPVGIRALPVVGNAPTVRGLGECLGVDDHG